jgi:ATP-grasp domain
VVVQPMVAGVELLAGVVQDAVFGPLVGFGAGGILAELLKSAGFRLAPLTDVDALQLVQHGERVGRNETGVGRQVDADKVAVGGVDRSEVAADEQCRSVEGERVHIGTVEVRRSGGDRAVRRVQRGGASRRPCLPQRVEVERPAGAAIVGIPLGEGDAAAADYWRVPVSSTGR